MFQQLRDPDALEGKCGECRYEALCGGCRARAYAATGSFLAEEPFCTYRPDLDMARSVPLVSPVPVPGAPGRGHERRCTSRRCSHDEKSCAVVVRSCRRRRDRCRAAAGTAPASYDPNGSVVRRRRHRVVSVAGPDGTVGVHLDLKTATGTIVKVHLGPAVFIGMNNFSFFADDQILVRGAYVRHDGEVALWARQVTKEGQDADAAQPGRHAAVASGDRRRSRRLRRVARASAVLADPGDVRRRILDRDGFRHADTRGEA